MTTRHASRIAVAGSADGAGADERFGTTTSSTGATALLDWVKFYQVNVLQHLVAMAFLPVIVQAGLAVQAAFSAH
jgi:hypothetical protein